jgi:hypothetical protein
MNDDLILVTYTFFFDYRICAFDRTGKFLNQIGHIGQGPRDYYSIFSVFFYTVNPSVFVHNTYNILEYDFKGEFIRSFTAPKLIGEHLSNFSYAGNNSFIGHISYTGKNPYNYCLFDGNGKIVTCFPNHIFFEMKPGWQGNRHHGGLGPVRVEDRLYLKDYANDTIYCLENSTLQPAFVFGLGKYTYNKEYLEYFTPGGVGWREMINKTIVTYGLIGAPKYFFYEIQVPEILPTPKIKPVYRPMPNTYHTREVLVWGIYNIEDKTNILLDINDGLLSEKGIINDLNGGLSIFPRYYAGNNVVIDMWDAEKMKEILTEEYFASKTIKDQQAHQKLKELLKNLKEDDNPVVVVAKLK